MTTMQTDRTLRVGMVGAGIWAQAVELIESDSLPHVEEDVHDSWLAAGIETRDGLDPEWGKALRLTREATVAMQLLSTYQSVTFDAKLLVGAEDAVAITQRIKVSDGKDAYEPVAADPMIEVALAPTRHIWELIRRVLPPLDLARATPRAPKADAVEVLSVTLEEVPDALRQDARELARRIPTMPSLPPEVRDALEPQASIFAFIVAGERNATRHANDAWALGARGLYHTVPGRPGVFEVSAGHVGWRLVTRLAEIAKG